VHAPRYKRDREDGVLGVARTYTCRVLPTVPRVGGARTDIWADFAKTSATNGVSPRDCADTAQHGSADPVLMGIADTVSRRNGYRGKGLFSLCDPFAEQVLQNGHEVN